MGLERNTDGMSFLDEEFEVHGAGFGGCYLELGGGSGQNCVV
jgi:hypothetical protein